MPTQLQALEAFADTEQNSDLLRLENLLKRFNLFESIGVKTQELRHSDLLGCLLDPSQQHGLGTIFLREFLRIVQTTVEDKSTLATLDLNALNMNGCYVVREGQRIDILVVDELNRLAVIIENKIDSGERDGQLNRYYDAVYGKYLGYSIVPIYLTRDGNAPTDDRYHTASYMQVCRVIEQIVQQHHSALEVDVVVLLEHYAQMLRRHIVSDSDVAELCRSIYKQHKQALDLIFEHRPDQTAQIRDYLISLAQRQNILTAYSYGRAWVNFNLRDWDESLNARGLTLETTTLPYLSFFDISNNLAVGIWVSPGNSSDRRIILQLAKDNHLTGTVSVAGRGNWTKLTSFKMLDPRDYDRPQDEIEAIISEKWSSFLQDELPRITEAFQGAYWLCEAP